MRICPFCHQDVVWLVRLRSALQHRFLMCFECDAVWQEDQEISDVAGTNFDHYMLGLGQAPVWDDVERVEVQN